MDANQLALIWIEWANGEKLRQFVCKFDLDQRNASYLKSTQGLAKVHQRFQSICDSVCKGFRKHVSEKII